MLHLVNYLYYWQMGFNSVFKGLIERYSNISWKQREQNFMLISIFCMCVFFAEVNKIGCVFHNVCWLYWFHNADGDGWRCEQFTLVILMLKWLAELLMVVYFQTCINRHKKCLLRMCIRILLPCWILVLFVVTGSMHGVPKINT